MEKNNQLRNHPLQDLTYQEKSTINTPLTLHTQSPQLERRPTPAGGTA